MPHMLMINFSYPRPPSQWLGHEIRLHMFQDSPISRYPMARCELSSMKIHLWIDPHVTQTTLQLSEA